MTTPIWTGHLRKDPATGNITGELRDSWGWVVSLTATPDPSGGYTLSGVLGDPPAGLRVAAIDGEGA